MSLPWRELARDRGAPEQRGIRVGENNKETSNGLLRGLNELQVI